MTAEAVDVISTPRAARGWCPVCERPAGTVFLSASEVAAQLTARDRFFARRLRRHFSRDELRDVTNIALGTPATILRCRGCGVLIRDTVPGEIVFRDDAYGDDVLERLHAVHARAFREKEIDYRDLLPSGAQVVEVGCYAGGFLTVAADWGWSAIGLDIGRDPVRFCHERGLDARCLHLHECDLPVASLDGLFVWNCFEQIANPGEWLDAARHVLRTAGLLVIRIPDAALYTRCEQDLERGDAAAVGVMAFNGFLGWPHQFGYDVVTLRRIVQKHGFAFVNVLRRAAVRPLREAMHEWASDEEVAMISDVNRGWIELSFRKL